MKTEPAKISNFQPVFHKIREQLQAEMKIELPIKQKMFTLPEMLVVLHIFKSLCKQEVEKKNK